MAFSIPRNVPSFTNPQRQAEDQYWQSSAKSSSSSSSNSVQNRIGGIFKSSSADLPLYKDKPYYSSSSSTYGYRRRKRDVIFKKRVLVVVVILLFGSYWFFWGGDSGEVDGGEEGLKSGDSQLKQEDFVDGGNKKAGHEEVAIPEKKKLSWLSGKGSGIDWLKRRERVKDAFLLSWDAYSTYAWGFDEFHPVSRSGGQMHKEAMGWIIVDALDTLMIMGLTKELAHAREWVQSTLKYDIDQEVNTFETTIRMLGGLLSAHYLGTELKMDPGAKKEPDLYLEKATDLADRLLGAYNSDSGVPWASVNLKTAKGVQSHADGGASSTAEATSLQLEMKYLSQLMGEKLYWQKAERVMKVVDDNMVEDGLVPIYIYATTGHFRGSEIRLGSRGDSYYEYLLKQYLQTGEIIYAEMYHDALAGVKKHIVQKTKPNGYTYIAELPTGISGHKSPKMDHLVCFMPGTIILGATNGTTVEQAKKSGKWGQREEEDLKFAKELMKTCYKMYETTATGLAPEIVWLNTDDDGANDFIIKYQDAHNLQRPETVESLFVMWRLTKDEIYREWGWKIFKAFVDHATVEGGGFTSLESVTEVPTKKRDNMESFWLAETLKYLYLLFSEDELLPLDKVVFNTEAHPLPIFKPKSMLTTGWSRKPRGEPVPADQPNKPIQRHGQ